MAPATTIKAYQKIQNSAARVAFKNQKEMMLTHAYVNYIGCPLNTDALSKLLTIAFNTFQGNAPQYLKEKLQWKQFPRANQKIYIIWFNSGYSFQ